MGTSLTTCAYRFAVYLMSSLKEKGKIMSKITLERQALNKALKEMGFNLENLKIYSDKRIAGGRRFKIMDYFGFQELQTLHYFLKDYYEGELCFICSHAVSTTKYGPNVSRRTVTQVLFFKANYRIE